MFSEAKYNQTQNRMQGKINPFDIIRITQDIPARATISSNAPGTETIDIELPAGSILLSNTHNYIVVNEYSFVPQDSEQLDAIKNLYVHKPLQKVRILGYEISVADLSGNYQTLQRFDYASLQPWSPMPHIWVFAYLFLDDKVQELSSARFLSFVADTTRIKEIKANFKHNLITYQEAVGKIATHIKEQIKVRQQ